jgi:SAM-dependent methyltransferase
MNIFELYLRGEQLYGDNFLPNEIDDWFKDEMEGYWGLECRDEDNYRYIYHALNTFHGYRWLPRQTWKHVLGFGSAFGHELLPIIKHVEKITILEPSNGFTIAGLNGFPMDYRQPQANGTLPFVTDSLDLITCFGVLHHIPNVSAVVKELYRVLSPGGFALVREPIVSLGDWRKPRRGLTKRERGIPLKILRQIICSAGFQIRREQKCMFSLTSRLGLLFKGGVWNSEAVVRADSAICKLPIWSRSYHPAFVLQKLRPMDVFYVLTKKKLPYGL